MGNQFLKGLQRPAIMPEGSSLPDYSEANDGDVLQIASGEPTWGAVDALPEIEETDEGKVLTVVDNSGTLEAEWAEPSGGDSIPVIHIIADDQGGYTHDGTFAVLWAIGDGKPVKISVTGDFDFEYVGKTVQVASGTPSEPVPVKVSIGTSPLLFEYESSTQVKASHDVIDILADNSVSWDTSESLYVDLSV